MTAEKTHAIDGQEQHEQMLINSTKAQAEEELSNQEELNKQAEQAAAEES